MRAINLVLLVAMVIAPASWAETETDADRFWPHWRGPMDTGVSPGGDPPIEWSEEKNIRWKVPIPGAGSASPIVWDDRVFVTSSINTGDEDPSAPSAPPSGRRGHPGGVSTSNILQYDVFALRRSRGLTGRRATERDDPGSYHERSHKVTQFCPRFCFTQNAHGGLPRGAPKYLVRRPEKRVRTHKQPVDRRSSADELPGGRDVHVRVYFLTSQGSCEGQQEPRDDQDQCYFFAHDWFR